MELILTAIFAFLLAGLVKGVLGFGFPIIALVVLTLTLGLLDALAIIISGRRCPDPICGRFLSACGCTSCYR